MHIDSAQDRAMAQTVQHSRQRRAPRAWAQLLNVIMELAGECGELLHHAEKPWASVTFCGSRHTIAIAFTGADAVAAGEAFIAALPDHEFTIPRQLVADAAVMEVDHHTLPVAKLVVEVEVLLLDDG
jgi:hypothetical protein